MLSDIVKNPKSDFQILTIQDNKHSVRIKAKKLLRILQEFNYKEYASKHSYIQFSKKSPIDRTKLIAGIKKHYKKNYSNIKINHISVEPRSYIETIPLVYEIEVKKNSHLSNKGIFSIKTVDNKKIFFNYKIDATLEVYIARDVLKKGTELSNVNSKKKSIILHKFRAMPIQNIVPHTLEAKHKVKKETVLTVRDTAGLSLVKRGSNVSVTLNNSQIAISFSAKAVTSGRYGDLIKLKKSNGKKITAIVVGQNRVEMK